MDLKNQLPKEITRSIAKSAKDKAKVARSGGSVKLFSDILWKPSESNLRKPGATKLLAV